MTDHVTAMKARSDISIIRESNLFQPEVNMALSYAYDVLSDERVLLCSWKDVTDYSVHTCMKAPINLWPQEERENIHHLRVLIAASTPMTFGFKNALLMAHHMSYRFIMKGWWKQHPELKHDKVITELFGALDE